MIIKKFQGKTKDEAIALAKEEMGDAVVIMNVKEVRQKGLIGIFKSNIFEVTAALEDDSVAPKTFETKTFDGGKKEETKGHRGNFDVVADEDITIPPVSASDAEFVRQNSGNVQLNGVNESELKDAFAAVSELMNSSEGLNKSGVTAIDRYASAGTASKPGESGYKTEEKKYKSDEQTYKSEEDSFKSEETLGFRKLADEDFVKEYTGDVSMLKEAPVGVYDDYASRVKDDSFDEQQESQQFFKMLYKILLENEVDEIYINQILDDMERISHSTDGLQYMISNAYQKMILKMGQPKTVEISKNKPKVVFFIGPTGVGKTTTIAKIASKFKLEEDRNVALLTADTYRIAATDQLKNYADILGIPMSIVYSPMDIAKEIEKYKSYDVVFVDTAGFSHKNDEQRGDMALLIDKLPDEYDKDVYLVLSATTKYKDLKDIVDTYKTFGKFDLIFTKLDETSAYGNIYNIRQYTGANVSYVTTGQNVPNDIDEIDTQKLVKNLLGGR
ncbi:MAG: flagellar biosynthesis protein FlhF [Lachnospiraceae bacterium]|nr:flagellar biosynthesis protein FlhF [Lachnospiraceae bacterium]